MKKSLEYDMRDLVDIFEGFEKNLDKLSKTDLIDLAARLKPIAKNCEAIDKAVKAKVKQELNGEEGSVPGNMFKAVLKLVPTHRLDQKGLREGSPVIFNRYNEEVTDERVTFEVR